MKRFRVWLRDYPLTAIVTLMLLGYSIRGIVEFAYGNASFREAFSFSTFISFLTLIIVASGRDAEYLEEGT